MCRAPVLRSPRIAQLQAIGRGDADQAAEMARLQDRVDQLESLLGLDIELPDGLRLSPSVRQVFGMILKAKGSVRREALFAALYGGRPEADIPASADKCIDVFIYHLRAALAGHGISVETVRRGDIVAYGLTPAMRVKAAALIGAAA